MLTFLGIFVSHRVLLSRLVACSFPNAGGTPLGVLTDPFGVVDPLGTLADPRKLPSRRLHLKEGSLLATAVSRVGSVSRMLSLMDAAVARHVQRDS